MPNAALDPEVTPEIVPGIGLTPENLCALKKF